MDSNFILTSFNSKKEELINNYNVMKRETNIVYAVRYAELLKQFIEATKQFNVVFYPASRTDIKIGKYIVFDNSSEDNSHASNFVMTIECFKVHLFFDKKEDIYIQSSDEEYYDTTQINEILEEYGLGVNVSIASKNEIFILFDSKKVKDKNNEQKRGSSRTLKQ